LIKASHYHLHYPSYFADLVPVPSSQNYQIAEKDVTFPQGDVVTLPAMTLVHADGFFKAKLPLGAAKVFKENALISHLAMTLQVAAPEEIALEPAQAAASSASASARAPHAREDLNVLIPRNDYPPIRIEPISEAYSSRAEQAQAAFWQSASAAASSAGSKVIVPPAQPLSLREQLRIDQQLQLQIQREEKKMADDQANAVFQMRTESSKPASFKRPRASAAASASGLFAPAAQPQGDQQDATNSKPISPTT